MSIVPIRATTSATRCPTTSGPQTLQVAERRRPDPHAVGVGGPPVAHDEVAELALGRFDGMVGLARLRLDQPGHLAHDGPLRQSVEGLPDQPDGLPELFEPDQIPVVGVAPRAERHVELQLVVGGVRLVLADVAIDAGPAQRGAAEPQPDRVPGRDDADVPRALQPDPVVGQELLVLGDFLIHDLAELPDLDVPAGGNVQRKPADAHGVVGQPRAAVLLEQVENELALAERVEEHGHRPDVHGVGAQPEAMARDALQLGENRADVAGAAGHLDLHQLLDGLAVAQIVRGRRHVVHPVGQQNDLRPVPVLAQLLDAAVDVADDDVGVDHPLAVEPQHHPEHAMRAGVLRAHVDDELVGVEDGQCRCLASHDAITRSRLRPGRCADATTPSGSPATARPDPRADSPCAAGAPAIRPA